MITRRSRTLSLAAALGAAALALSACGSETGTEPGGSGGSETGSAAQTSSVQSSSVQGSSPAASESSSESSSPASSPSSTGAASSSPAAAPSSGSVEHLVAVYEDFACPHCASFHQRYGGLLLDLTKEGSADVEYRIVDFLGRGDPESWSTRAANAFYCFEEAAEDQAKTHAYQSQLFEAADQSPDDAQLVARAADMDVDIAACVEADGGDADIRAALNEFRAAGLRGVPSISADGQAYDGQTHGDFGEWVTSAVGSQGIQRDG